MFSQNDILRHVTSDRISSPGTMLPPTSFQQPRFQLPVFSFRVFEFSTTSFRVFNYQFSTASNDLTFLGVQGWITGGSFCTNMKCASVNTFLEQN